MAWGAGARGESCPGEVLGLELKQTEQRLEGGTDEGREAERSEGRGQRPLRYQGMGTGRDTGERGCGGGRCRVGRFCRGRGTEQ